MAYKMYDGFTKKEQEVINSARQSYKNNYSNLKKREQDSNDFTKFLKDVNKRNGLGLDEKIKELEKL